MLKKISTKKFGNSVSKVSFKRTNIQNEWKRDKIIDMQIIDNFLPQDFADQVLKELNSADFPWYLNQYTS